MGPDTYMLLIAQDAPKYMISVGDKGTDVKEFEDRLYELGYIEKASNTFSEDTEAAVKKFQQLNGLTEDGKVGQDTFEMLYSDNVKANFLSSGEKSDKVLACQKRLNTLGYLTTTPDGTYGADTVNAVKRFQSVNGLIVDGYLGPKTISLLNSDQAQSNALMLGMSGSDITNIQKHLVTLKYLSKSTGYYGSGTVNAVKAFQKQNKLTVDGKVGRKTMNALQSSSAKAAPPKTSGGSSGSSSGSSSGGDTKDEDTSVATGVEKLIEVAKTKLGCSYVRGAKGPSSFDCSGFVYWCLNNADVVQSYMTSASWQNCTKYQRIEGMKNLERGDIISFKGHVGIYLGNGEMINALPDSGVKISKDIMSSSYWTSHFVCGFRIF
jgi:peptidoglycan hydrolase-like protein with peptidoglycan-binding domain